MCVVESVLGAPMIKHEPADGLLPLMHYVPYASLLSPLVFPQMSHGMFPMSGMGSIIVMGGMVGMGWDGPQAQSSVTRTGRSVRRPAPTTCCRCGTTTQDGFRSVVLLQTLPCREPTH